MSADEPPDTANRFLVGVLEDTILVSGLTPRRLTRAEALNLAAWLVACVDACPGAGPSPTDPNLPESALSEFERLIAAVWET